MEKFNDILGYKNLNIIQDDDCLLFSLDSVMLANFCSIRLRDKKSLDIGCGNGIISLILSERNKKIKIDALDIQKKLCDLTKKNIDLNKLNDRINCINIDIKNYCGKNISNNYDLIVCNPPFFEYSENSIINESVEKSIARHEIMIKLEDIVCCSSKLLKSGGNFSIVHRNTRFIDIISNFRKYKIEPKRVRFVYENIDKESTLVLVEGQKDGKTGLTIEKPLVLFNMDGSYTDEYKKIIKEVNVCETD